MSVFTGRHKHEKVQQRRILARTGEILSLVFRHGFGHLLGTPDRRKARLATWSKAAAGSFAASKDKPADQPETRHPHGPTRWERIRMLLEDLGPTFIKMGQIFSNRPDILPEELLVELRKLQDKVPVFPFETARELLEAEYGRPLDDVFASIKPEPIASASIAQVYQAVLPTGQSVAVKVQRPGIEDVVQVDLEILKGIGKLFEKLILRSDVIDTNAILSEFSRTLLKELDFKNEAMYLEKFAANFRGEASIYVPALYRKYSTRRVLVMEFVSGLHPLDFHSFRHHHLDRRKLAEDGANLMLTQIFIHGFFHADPHPGNLLILPTGQVCFLDFGMMGVLFERHREQLAAMLLAVASADSQGLSKALTALALNEVDDSLRMEEDVFTLLETFSHLPLKEINMGEFLTKAIDLMVMHKLQMPPSLYLLLKSLITTEGLARQLDPDFDLLSHVTPFVQRIFTDKLNPIKAGGRSAESALGYLSLAADLPDELRDALKVLKKGKISLVMEKDTLDQILHKADRISNRIAFALVATGGVLASSLALQTKIPPLWNDIPIIALVGFIGTALMGFALLISIWRSGRF